LDKNARSGVRADYRAKAMSADPVILLVEDEQSIAEPFAGALRREGFSPVLAPTVAEALRCFEEREPDAVVLDVGLPDGDGRELCVQLRRRSGVPIIMLTARGTETDKIVGLELGADDYVVKPFSSAEVIARLRAILRRAATTRTPTQPPTLRFGALQLEPAARIARLDGVPLTLARKEFDLLALLATRAGSVVRREDLMAEVWDENWFGSTKTLDVHVGALRRKLGDDPADPTYIHTVRGVGFRFTEPDPEPGSPEP
jgi:DNA-binding response OmpR family regulator